MIQVKGKEEYRLDTLIQEGEWYEYPGTKFALKMIELSPDQINSTVRQSTVRTYDKASRGYIEKENTSKSRKIMYERAIEDCRGLTPRIVRDALKLKWNPGLADDHEIRFDSLDEMHDLLYAIGSKSSRLNRFICHRILPDPEVISDEDDSTEDEKKTSATGS